MRWMGVPVWFAVLGMASACRGQEEKEMKPTSTKPPMAEAARKVMESPIAGTWYPANATTLRSEIEGYLAEVPASEADGRVVGLVSPHAGYRYSGRVAAHGFKRLAAQDVARVIVVAPSHRVPLTGFALPDATAWRTPLGDVAIDGKTVEALAAVPGFVVRNDAFAREHALDIQLPFLQVVAPRALLVPILAGRLDAGDVVAAGKALGALMDERTVFVASSDFTHFGPDFGFEPFRDDVPAGLKRLADAATDAIVRRDAAAFGRHLARTGDTICGAGPIRVMLAALSEGVVGVPVTFDTSGRITGDFENSVSYVSIAFHMATAGSADSGGSVLDEAARRYVVSLARRTLRQYLAGRGRPDPDGAGETVPDAVRRNHGVFVTLKKGGNLRGCIGSILPTEPLLQGVVRNAVNAAVNDPRFPPMTPEEEPEVAIEVSVLTPPTDVASWRDIVIGRDGIILAKGRARSVFLPQVAPEQGWTLEETLTHLALKAGLRGDEWRSGASFQVFQAQVIEERDVAPPR